MWEKTGKQDLGLLLLKTYLTNLLYLPCIVVFKFHLTSFVCKSAVEISSCTPNLLVISLDGLFQNQSHPCLSLCALIFHFILFRQRQIVDGQISNGHFVDAILSIWTDRQWTFHRCGQIIDGLFVNGPYCQWPYDYLVMHLDWSWSRLCTLNWLH